MRYLTTQEIKSETKVGKSIYLFDLFFLIIYMSVSFILGNIVHEYFRIIFYGFSMVMALALTAKSFTNHRRRNYEAIILFFQKDTEIYRPVKNISKKPKGDESVT